MRNFFFVLAILVVTVSSAQYEHNIQLNDGSIITHNLTEIDSISFGTDGVPMMHLNLINQSSMNFVLELINQVTYNQIEGSITSLNCDIITGSGTLTAWVEATEVSSTIAYNGGNGGPHFGLEIDSEGVTGLNASLVPGEFNNGPGILSFNITGTPSGSGTASFAINLGGQSCFLNLTVELPVGSIANLECDNATFSGTLTAGEAATGVSASIPYTGGNGGTHSGQSVVSMGVNGLNASLTSGTFTNGNGVLSYTITGTPQSTATANFAINIGGQICLLTIAVNPPVPNYPPGTVHCLPDGAPTEVVEITHPNNGSIWMDRNMGASQAATSTNDIDSYGDLYQWGRFSDGHQCRNSDTTSTKATTAASNLGNSWDGKFIIEPLSPWDWLSTQNDNLWQGVNGTNNPCPNSYRIPTEAEWLTWDITDSNTAWGSVLKLPTAGFRHETTGELSSVFTGGGYWSSTVSGYTALNMGFGPFVALVIENRRNHGFSVRCIRD